MSLDLTHAVIDHRHRSVIHRRTAIARIALAVGLSATLGVTSAACGGQTADANSGVGQDAVIDPPPDQISQLAAVSTGRHPATDTMITRDRTLTWTGQHPTTDTMITRTAGS